MATEINLAATLLGSHQPPPEPVHPQPPSPEEMEKLKGHFLASLNHELRTPLSGVIGMTDLLLETQLDEEQREYVGTVRECAAQLFETLNCVLEYSSLTAGTSKVSENEFPVAVMLQALMDEFRPRAMAKGLKTTCQFADKLPELIEADDRLIRKAIEHLLRNAVKFTSSGEVRLTARLDWTNSPRPFLRVDVSDTGIGIPQGKLRVIFESFQQLDNGLARSYAGLAQVRHWTIDFSDFRGFSQDKRRVFSTRVRRTRCSVDL
ncbi:MAG: hypothetical protein FJW39_09780, partial [Acidobacteria bacterium]|nr:hypothetical protein [Acidobacteriota bacterium]